MEDIDTFTGLADRQSVLAEILRHGPARPGITLIALVERGSLAVLGVRAVPTPQPRLDPAGGLTWEHIARLRELLRQVAHDLVPEHDWTPDGALVSGELLTVVCREGAARITPAEWQYSLGWHYSNHFRPVLDGEVFAVTPSGWTAALAEVGSDRPALPGPPPTTREPDRARPVPATPTAPTATPTPSSAAATPGESGGPVAPRPAARRPEPASFTGPAEAAVRAAEAIVDAASATLLAPRPRECLLCFVYRMVGEFPCAGLRFALRYRDLRAPRATALAARLGRVGGFCDCEIFLNGYEPRPELLVPGPQAPDGLDWPDPMPACAGVRAGSTQPCRWWRRRGRHRGSW